MRLIIDTRETGSVAAQLDELGTAYTIEPLNVGDFAIKNENEEFVAVWERKSCADLAASINDGRYAEQKCRLLALECRWKGYLIEGYYPVNGVVTKGRHPVVPRSTFDSVKLGLTLRDGFTVYELSDAKHTAVFLSKMMTKIPEYLSAPGSKGGAEYEESLIKSISTVRKENMTPEVCYLAQLCQIPGVSHTIAQAIQTVYPTMRALLNADLKLAEIQVSSSRRLGKVLAQRINEYMDVGSKPKPKPVIVKKREESVVLECS
jgi:ERCC4-type nuclease